MKQFTQSQTSAWQSQTADVGLRQPRPGSHESVLGNISCLWSVHKASDGLWWKGQVGQKYPSTILLSVFFKQNNSIAPVRKQYYLMSTVILFSPLGFCDM